MPPTKQDCLRVVKKESPQAPDVTLALLDVAAVKATELTGHPGWDRFLEQLQAMLDQAEKEAAVWTEHTINAHGTDDLRYAQRSATAYKVQVELLRRIMNLPGQILKEQHAAQSR